MNFTSKPYKDQNLEQSDDLFLDSAHELTDDEKIDIVAHRILNKYRQAFEELAK